MENENRTLEQVYSKEIERMELLGMKPEKILKELSFAMQHISKSKQLQKCSQESKRAAIVNIANIGLTLNPVAKEAYLLPRWSSITGSVECCLEPSYIGLTKLLTDTGSVKSIVCNLVYANDSFEIDLANNQNPVIHKPQLIRSMKGEVIGVYALATLPDGTRQVEWMDKEELYTIRDRSESYKAYLAKKIEACTWTTDEGEMMRKTVSKRIYKYLPRTEQMQNIDNAISVDNEDYAATDSQIDFINTLLETSSFDHEQRKYIEYQLTNISGQKAGEIIENLKLNQLDRVTQGSGYGSNDITNHCESLA